MDLQKTLERIGLSDKEASVYLTLLGFQEALPSVISRKSGVKRPTTYVILEYLEKRGLASHVKKGTTLYYRALNPYALLEDQHRRYSDLERALPELVGLHEKYAAIPQMTVYEGKEGIVEIMEDTLKTSTELLCWADVISSATTLLKDYYRSYVDTKVKRKIWLRGIFCYDKLALEYKKRGEEELREVYLIPKDKFPFKNEINIYDDKVAIVSHQDKVGVIIQNKNIADTQRSIFNFGFEYAKILEKGILTKEDIKYLG
ncbi:MAG: helix-turn-helix domain-containing protein [Candidatus Gracilibacteria bacterium]|jgi:sugar-specific transcriptional regulator TrmB